MLERTLTHAAATLAVGVGALVAGSGVANAAEPVDMNIACQVTHGQIGWRATLSYPNQGGWGWRCYLVGNAGDLKGVNIEKYCQDIYGLHARGGSTAYNWRCDN